MKSYEQQSAEVWYAMFCEAWDDFTESDPPAIDRFDGEDMGEDPAVIAHALYYESIDGIDAPLIRLNDSDALDAVAHILRQPEWDNQTIEEVAEIVGYVRNLEET